MNSFFLPNNTKNESIRSFFGEIRGYQKGLSKKLTFTYVRIVSKGDIEQKTFNKTTQNQYFNVKSELYPAVQCVKAKILMLLVVTCKVI